MKRQARTVLSLLAGLLGLWLTSVASDAARAADRTVCLNGWPVYCEYTSIQAAVDAAQPGDVVKIAAGAYTEVITRAGVMQVVYISKPVTLRGGYNIPFTVLPDPDANPTILDAGGQGRALYVTGTTGLRLEGLRLTGGRAELGGGLYAINAAVGISRSHIYRNLVTLSGGGVYALGGTVGISRSHIYSNTATRGGGVYTLGGTVGISRSHIYSNTAYYGGGVGVEGGQAALQANVIYSNAASLGGGVYVAGAATTILTNTITANTAYASGGGLYLEGVATPRLVSNTITANMAYASGGGLHLKDSTDAALVRNTIKANTAYAFGGGVYVTGTSTTVLTNTLAANAAQAGGGLYLSRSNALFRSNIARYNTASRAGGGLYFFDSAPTLANTVIADNQADQYGSGLYISDSSPRLWHTTIARNTGGAGSGVYIAEPELALFPTVVLSNTILVDHAIGISVTGGNTVTAAGVLWHNTPITISKAGTAVVTVSNSYEGAPAFNSDGYHIVKKSAAISQGIASGVTTDLDGDEREYENCDLGADEFYAQPKASIGQRVSPDPIQAGEQLVYSLRITNTGNITLTARITDVLPVQVSTTQPLTWTPVIAAPGGVWTANVAGVVALGYSGTLTNEIRVAAQETTTIWTNILTSTALVSPALLVTKQAYPDPVEAGARLTYTLRVTNTGNIDLHAVITDHMPGQIAGGQTSGGMAVSPGQAVTWAPVITAPGGVWTQTIVVTTAVGYSGTLINQVEVTTAEGAAGHGAETTWVQALSALVVAKQAHPSPVQAGARLTYTLRVTNTGLAHLHATITDKLPMAILPGELSDGTVISPGLTLTWTATLPAPDGVWVYEFPITVTPGYAGQLVNVVKVTTAEGAAGTSSRSTTALAPHLQISKQAEPNPVQAGSPITYTICVTNTGNVPLHAVITDTLPAHLNRTGILTWALTVPALGVCIPRVFSATVEAGYSGPLVNVVRVTTTEGATGVYTHTARSQARTYMPIVIKQWYPYTPPPATLYLHRAKEPASNFLSAIRDDGDYVGFEFDSVTEWQTTLSDDLVGGVYGYDLYLGSPYPDRGGGVTCDVEILLRRGAHDTLLVSWPAVLTTFTSYQAVLFSATKTGVDPTVQPGDVLILRIRPLNGEVRIWMSEMSGNGGYSSIRIPGSLP